MKFGCNFECLDVKELTQPPSSPLALHMSQCRTAQGKYDPSSNLTGRYLHFNRHYAHIYTCIHHRAYFNVKRSLMWILVLLFLFKSVHFKRTKVLQAPRLPLNRFFCQLYVDELCSRTVWNTTNAQWKNVITASYATHLSSHPERCCDLARNTIGSTL